MGAGELFFASLGTENGVSWGHVEANHVVWGGGRMGSWVVIALDLIAQLVNDRFLIH
jgi:hypothetical protein